MLRGVSGFLVTVLTALLVSCSADRHQEPEAIDNDSSADRYDAAGHKPRTLDPLRGGNLVREVRESRHFVPYVKSRRFDYVSPYSGGGKRELRVWPFAAQYGGYYDDGLPKRNFDEIDRSGLDNFVKKRNFDEIDQTSMPFPYATKRFYHLYGPNYLDLEKVMTRQCKTSNVDKKRYWADYPMDEIELSQFSIGSKRSQDSYHPLR